MFCTYTIEISKRDKICNQNKRKNSGTYKTQNSPKNLHMTKNCTNIFCRGIIMYFFKYLKLMEIWVLKVGCLLKEYFCVYYQAWGSIIWNHPPFSRDMISICLVNYQQWYLSSSVAEPHLGPCFGLLVTPNTPQEWR